MSIKTIKTRPYKFLFLVSLTFCIIIFLLWAYSLIVDNSYSDRSELERNLRSLVFLKAFIPEFLIYSSLYWLMYKFKKPTRSLFNIIHVSLLLSSVLIMMSMGLMGWFDASKKLIVNYTIQFFTYSIPGIFIINIIISLIKSKKSI